MTALLLLSTLALAEDEPATGADTGAAWEEAPQETEEQAGPSAVLPAVPEADPGRRLAVLGIASGVMRGPGLVAPAAASASWVVGSFGGALNLFDTVDARLLTGSQTTEAELTRAVEDMAEPAGDDDVLIVWVSSSVADGSLSLDGGEFPTADFAELVEAAGFGTVVVFSDIWTPDPDNGAPLVPDLRLTTDAAHSVEIAAGAARENRARDPIPTTGGSNLAYYARANLENVAGDTDYDGILTLQELVAVLAIDLEGGGWGGGGVMPVVHGEVPELSLVRSSDDVSDDGYGSGDYLGGSDIGFYPEDFGEGAGGGAFIRLFFGAGGGPIDPVIVDEGDEGSRLQSRAQGVHGHWGVALGMRGPWWFNPSLSATSQRVHGSAVVYSEDGQLTDIRPSTRWILEVREDVVVFPNQTLSPFAFVRAGTWTGSWTAPVDDGPDTYRFRGGPIEGPFSTGAGLGLQVSSYELDPGFLTVEFGADRLWDDAPIDGLGLVMRGSVGIGVPL